MAEAPVTLSEAEAEAEAAKIWRSLRGTVKYGRIDELVLLAPGWTAMSPAEAHNTFEGNAFPVKVSWGGGYSYQVNS